MVPSVSGRVAQLYQQQQLLQRVKQQVVGTEAEAEADVAVKVAAGSASTATVTTVEKKKKVTDRKRDLQTMGVSTHSGLDLLALAAATGSDELLHCDDDDDDNDDDGVGFGGFAGGDDHDEFDDDRHVALYNPRRRGGKSSLLGKAGGRMIPTNGSVVSGPTITTMTSAADEDIKLESYRPPIVYSSSYHPMMDALIEAATSASSTSTVAAAAGGNVGEYVGHGDTAGRAAVVSPVALDDEKRVGVPVSSLEAAVVAAFEVDEMNSDGTVVFSPPLLEVDAGGVGVENDDDYVDSLRMRKKRNRRTVEESILKTDSYVGNGDLSNEFEEEEEEN